MSCFDAFSCLNVLNISSFIVVISRKCCCTSWFTKCWNAGEAEVLLNCSLLWHGARGSQEMPSELLKQGKRKVGHTATTKVPISTNDSIMSTPELDKKDPFNKTLNALECNIPFKFDCHDTSRLRSGIGQAYCHLPRPHHPRAPMSPHRDRPSSASEEHPCALPQAWN